MLLDKLAGESTSSMLVGCKLFKHPYARNNHASGLREIRSLASLREKCNSAFGNIILVDQGEEVHGQKRTPKKTPPHTAERHAVLSVAPANAHESEPQSRIG